MTDAGHRLFVHDRRAALWDCDYVGDSWDGENYRVDDLIDSSYDLGTGENWEVKELWGIDDDNVMVGTVEVDGTTPTDEPAVMLVPLRAKRIVSNQAKVEWAVDSASVDLHYSCSISGTTDRGKCL